ncbi:MAG TPA: energy transducer TonB [Pyrinomonadaceae bacterium]|nr:energy transducer TonB [Acidobacteriota bacterium]HQZ95393.1 energy transducer TonB [Pyrinomonadaceae bacterium]
MSFKRSNIIALVITFAAFTIRISAQESENRDGIALLNKGDFAGAVKALKDSDSFIDLYYLGRAYENLANEKDAKKAYDKSVKRGYRVVEGEIRKRLPAADDKPVAGMSLSTFLQEFAPKLTIAAKAARRAFELKGQLSKENEWIMKSRFLYELDKAVNQDAVYSNAELDTELMITAKSPPGYTDAARKSDTTGTIVLICLFSREGKVTAAMPVKALANGLTEQAYVAAEKIGFKPGIKNGRPVTSLRTIAYSFSIY